MRTISKKLQLLNRNTPAGNKKSHCPNGNKRRTEAVNIHVFPLFRNPLESSYDEVIECTDNYKNRQRIIGKGKRESEGAEIPYCSGHSAAGARHVEKQLYRTSVDKPEEQQYHHRHSGVFKYVLCFCRHSSLLSKKLSRR